MSSYIMYNIFILIYQHFVIVRILLKFDLLCYFIQIIVFLNQIAYYSQKKLSLVIIIYDLLISNNKLFQKLLPQLKIFLMSNVFKRKYYALLK